MLRVQSEVYHAQSESIRVQSEAYRVQSEAIRVQSEVVSRPKRSYRAEKNTPVPEGRKYL